MPQVLAVIGIVGGIISAGAGAGAAFASARSARRFARTQRDRGFRLLGIEETAEFGDLRFEKGKFTGTQEVIAAASGAALDVGGLDGRATFSGSFVTVLAETELIHNQNLQRLTDHFLARQEAIQQAFEVAILEISEFERATKIGLITSIIGAGVNLATGLDLGGVIPGGGGGFDPQLTQLGSSAGFDFSVSSNLLVPFGNQFVRA